METKSKKPTPKIRTHRYENEMVKTLTGEPLPNQEVYQSAKELLAVCTAVLLECPGIWNTCQSTGETFGDMLDTAIAKAEGRA